MTSFFVSKFTGLLGEDLLEKALKVNDALLRTLEAEKVREHAEHFPLDVEDLLGCSFFYLL